MIGAKPFIFLLTDFGVVDQYVAVMKAVILQRCPDAQLVDITHAVAPQAVEQGAYLLESAWPWMPEGSVLLAVVDPGVGSEREPAVFYHEGKCAVGPNNGLFGFLPPDVEGRVLDRPKFWLEEVSSTFHGRDIFAPCAAFVAAGGHWARLGSKVTRPVQLNEPSINQVPATSRQVTARIIHTDHFGNLITNYRCEAVAIEGAVVSLSPGTVIPVHRTFADVAAGSAVAYAGSTGRLEIAVRNGDARVQLGLSVGDTVSIRLR